jgi:hypothetical protein
MIESVPGTYRAKARIVLVSPCNEALKQGRITSHLLRGLIVQVPARRAKVILATNEQLEVMAAKLGDRGLMVWLGAMAGTRMGESLGVNVADLIRQSWRRRPDDVAVVVDRDRNILLGAVSEKNLAVSEGPGA